MKSLVPQKTLAIQLRKAGYSYREILEKVPVSKSSLSLWLRDIPLTEAEKSVMKRRRIELVSRGRIRAAASLHKLRTNRDAALLKKSQDLYKNNRENPLFHIGISLYWAEGSKRDGSFSFINSDIDMMKIMLDWMNEFLKISRENIRARLYIHKPYAHENLEAWWSRETGIPLQNFRNTIYKPTGLLVKKRPEYKGCLRIEAGGVVALRTYLFWQKMLLDEHKKQRYSS